MHEKQITLHHSFNNNKYDKRKKKIKKRLLFTSVRSVFIDVRLFWTFTQIWNLLKRFDFLRLRISNVLSWTISDASFIIYG